MIQQLPKDSPLADSGWLQDLSFVDLYVSLYDELPSYYQSTTPGSLIVQLHDLPDEYNDDIAQLRTQLESVLKDKDEASLTYDGLRLRACKIISPSGATLVALRRIGEQPPALAELGFESSVTQSLYDLGRRDGLFLICGGTGQGKSTTAASMLYDYLVRYGGVGITIEDPVEFILEGRHGKSGLCYQMEVQKEKDWANYLHRALRWHPRYILVGELRSPEAANQLLRAANSGHLVIATMHSGSIEEGLEGLVHLAEQAIGNQAPILLASALAGIFYQSFDERTVRTRMYLTEGSNRGDPVRSLIRENKIGQATTFIDQQKARRDQPLIRAAQR